MAEFNTDTDPKGSNNLIRSYLASKGLQPNGENIRRALEGNAANPGLIRGLVNSTPSTEADDQAAMARAHAAGAGGSGGGGRTSAAPTAPAGAPTQVAQQDTQPPLDTGGDNDIAMQILRGLGIGAGGAALAGGALGAGARMMGNRSPGSATEPAINVTPPGGLPVPGSPEALPTVRNSTATQGPVERITLPGVDDARIIPGAPQVEGGGVRLGLPGPTPPGALGGPADPALIGAPPRQITGPPGPAADARPVAPGEAPIALPGPVGRTQAITPAPAGQPIILPAAQLPQPGTAPVMATGAPVDAGLTDAINKAVGGSGDTAPPRRVRSPRARTPKVRVPG